MKAFPPLPSPSKPGRTSADETLAPAPSPPAHAVSHGNPAPSGSGNPH